MDAVSAVGRPSVLNLALQTTPGNGVVAACLLLPPTVEPQLQCRKTRRSRSRSLPICARTTLRMLEPVTSSQPNLIRQENIGRVTSIYRSQEREDPNYPLESIQSNHPFHLFTAKISHVMWLELPHWWPEKSRTNIRLLVQGDMADHLTSSKAVFGF